MLKITFIKERMNLFAGTPLLSCLEAFNPLSRIDTLEGLKHKTISNTGIKFFAALEKVLIAPPKKYHKTFEELDIDSFNTSLDNFKKTNSVTFPYRRHQLYSSTPSGKSSLSAYVFASKMSSRDLDELVLDKDLIFYIKYPETALHLNLGNLPDLTGLHLRARRSISPNYILDSLSGIEDN